MRKQPLVWIFACLSGLASAQEYASVHIEYVGGPDPQGTYLLVSDREGRFPLESISKGRNLQDVKIEGIIPALVREHPALADKITVSPFQVNTSDLIKAGEVQISGHVKNPGKYPADTLAACIAKAVPTEFGSIRRIQVISGAKIARYDCKQNASSQIQLKPGDIVFIPMKTIIGG
jgi:Periplasmic protein involved in polysaccharide export